MKTIKKIVFTGGPCAGKTTFVSRAEEIFGERGYRVIIDNESASDLITGGISPATMGMYEFQKYVIELQLKKEDICYRAAQEIEGDKVLIFIDRGLYDDKSYVTDDDFKAIIKDFDFKEEEINSRYDMVMHLTTSAKGAEEAYTYQNNSARYETVEQARASDDAILRVWQNHPNRVVIGNETDFEDKMTKAIQAVTSYLGEEKPVDIFKDFLVEVDADMIEKIKKESNFTYTQIFQHYLTSPNGTERRIRKRERNGQSLYYYSEATTIAPGERIKTDRVLSQREYNDFTKEIDKNLNSIDKKRYSFFYDNHFFKLDIFNFDESKGLLSVQLPEKNDQFTLPEYIKIVKEVTNDRNYKNYYLAKTQKF